MNANEKKVIGVWSLVSQRRFRDGAFYRYPMGEEVTGRLIYSESGIMAAFLMSKEWRQGTAAPDWQTFLSYSGAWSVDDAGRVVHRVDACSLSRLIGTELVRHATHRDAETLLLSTEPHMTSGGHKSHDELVWKRARSQDDAVLR